MNPRPDSMSDPLKEAVLATCPFTRTFLDIRRILLNPTQWLSDAEAHSKALNRIFDAKLGETWPATLLVPQVVLVRNLEVFDSVDNEHTLDLVNVIIRIGYELETGEKTELLVGDLLSRFRDTGGFNPALLATNEGVDRIASVFSGLLSVGRYIRRLPADGATVLFQPQSPSSDPFGEFVQGLNLDE